MKLRCACTATTERCSMCNKKENKMIDPKFKDVKVGDWIFTCRSGWVKIFQFLPDLVYYIDAVDSKGKPLSYTTTGKYNKHDKYPTAWTYNPFDPEDKPPCEFKKGEVVMVRDQLTGYWKPFIVGKDTVYGQVRKLTPEEKGE